MANIVGIAQQSTNISSNGQGFVRLIQLSTSDALVVVSGAGYLNKRELGPRPRVDDIIQFIGSNYNQYFKITAIASETGVVTLVAVGG